MLFALGKLLNAQNISINSNGSAPDNSAMLDVTSTNRGMLIPRMTEAQRISIVNPATGLLVFQIDNDSGFYYNSGTAALPSWERMLIDGEAITILQDADGDTKVEVEQNPDEDVIRFGTHGTEFFRLDSGRLSIVNTNNNYFIGQNTGQSYDYLNNVAEPNLAIGNSSMQSITTARKNVAIGNQALRDLTIGGDNTAIGISTLARSINGSSNTAIGAYSLTNNTVGNLNTAVGRFSLVNFNSGTGNTVIGEFAAPSLTSGDANVIIGRNGLENNTGSSNNTVIGSEAGRSNITGASNVFLGYQAGYNELGSDKLYIENSLSASPLIYGNFAADSLIVNGSLTVGSAYTFPISSPGASGDVLRYNGTNLEWGSNAITDLASVLANGNDAAADTIINLQGINIGNARPIKTSLEIDSFFVVSSKTFNGFRWAGYNAYYDGVSAAPQYLNDGYADIFGQGQGRLIIGHWGLANANDPLSLDALSSINLEDSSITFDGVAQNFNINLRGIVTVDSFIIDNNYSLPTTSPGAVGDVLMYDGSLVQWSSVSGDNLGNHIATTNIELNGNYLSGDGDNEGIYVDNAGNVGIGTTSPSTRFTVSQNSASAIMDLQSAGSNTLMDLNNTGTNPASWSFGYLGNTGVNPGFFTFLRGGIHRMAITNNGNVGIRTTTPGYSLDVNGSARVNNLRVNTTNLQFGASMEVADRMNIIGAGNPALFIGPSGSDYVYLDFVSASGYGRLFTPGTNDLILQAGGNVGIGVTNPSSELEVGGDIEIPAVNDYTYSTPKTHYQSFAPTTFNSLLPDQYSFGTFNAATSYAYFRSGGTTFGYATVEVNLPDGADVRELRGWIYDDLTTNPVRVQLLRQQLGSSATQVMVEIESDVLTATTAIQDLSNNTVFNNIVDNSIYAYFLRFTGRQNSTQSRLYGARITYNVTETD